MRLSSFEVQAIIETKNDIFGLTSKIYLFGSRVDDTQKGGDIDLFLVTDKKDDLFDKKINFLVALQEKVGEQKIDLIFSKDKSRDIEIEARQKGVILDLNEIKLQKDGCVDHKSSISQLINRCADTTLAIVKREYILIKGLTKKEF